MSLILDVINMYKLGGGSDARKNKDSAEKGI